MVRLLSTVFFLCLLAACTHDKVPPPPPPEIVINSPAANAHFVKGDTIHISGTVTHILPITEVAVHMVNMNSGDEFFHNHFSAGGNMTYTFNAEYVIDNDDETTYKVEVEAADSYNSYSTEELEIIIN